MFRKSLTAFLLSLLIILGFFAFSVQAVTIKPPVLLTIDDVPVTEDIPKITNRTPTLVVRCNIPFAIIDYKINNPQMIDSHAADKRGIWRWTVPQKLNYGYQTIKVTATNPDDLTDVRSRVFEFEVVRTDINAIKLGIPKLLGIVVLAVIAFIAYKKFKRRAHG